MTKAITIRLDEADHAALQRQSERLKIRPGRHATDAAYVRLAQRLGTTLWTLDAALARNAADVGLPVELVA